MTLALVLKGIKNTSAIFQYLFIGIFYTIILKDLLLYLADTVDTDACQEFPRFMFECEFGRIYDDFCDRNPTSTVDPDLIEHLGKELDPDLEEIVRNFLMWPDNAHLGATGQLFFVDYLLKFCEDKGILKT